MAKSLRERMVAKVQGHMKSIQERVKNPLIPNNFFDFSDAGFPEDFDVFPVEVPNANSALYAHQLGILRDFYNCGWQHIEEDMVSRTPASEKACIPNYVAIDGLVTVAHCYLLYTDRDWHKKRRAANVEARNNILARKKEEFGRQTDEDGSTLKVEEERTDVTLESLMTEGDPLKHEGDKD